MKKILVINGHPDKKSFNTALAQSYINSAINKGAEVRYIPISDLKFNPNLQYGYRQRMDLEPDLIRAIEDIKWSEHQVWIHPLWWLGMPALMKGFFDRAFLPGITFKSNKDGENHGLLNSKTARIITTAGDLSLAAYEDVYQSSGLTQLQKGILEYCGVSDIKNDFIGPLYEFSEDDRINTLEKTAIAASLDIGSGTFIKKK
ncbi:NAD(P)H-dependent oxidoreductase [Sphingobacterium faecale]|uniref:NAD(P)H-dependent oxidoreductase n=1 Tax=Sphingobacterium faecale TaxID=2803775 RepID=A0ABS1R5E1_9SPHI|nr:NAD(P)H-dependent oxidoreductase [Sphingobacterium faecale]MBL1409928.1 NAD(P)H-dependent oxidoreductase [Sphingobacterium faecale]